MKRLYDVLKDCKKEEEVKAEFCKYFKYKINAFKSIDHYTKEILFEFKLDKNFKSIRNIAAVIAQTMYYCRLLKYGNYTNPLPPIIAIIDKNETFFFETKKFKSFYTSNKYDWDRAASCPDQELIKDIEQDKEIRNIHVYNLQQEQEEEQFKKLLKEYSQRQLFLFKDLDKKVINEDNFLEVYKQWADLFGKYVQNGRKPSEYFLSDIETDKSNKMGENKVCFDLGEGNAKIKSLPIKDYDYFWSLYNKTNIKEIPLIRQKADRISEDYERRFTGEFYTPVEFAQKGLQYLEKVIGKNWWKTGNYRFWDMAAGTGNLEFDLPSSALKYCYISTLLEDDAKYCKRIFPDATCFQYDYLNDDIPFLDNSLNLDYKRKMPENLLKDLQNPKIKWIIFINPPFATSNVTEKKVGKESKDTVSMTSIRKMMTDDNLGETSRELFSQFLYRISKEFKNKSAHLCLFSKIKYLNSKNDQKMHDIFFKYKYEKGFIFPSKSFQGTKENFPVGFLVWNLSKEEHLENQKIILDVFNENVEKYGTKEISTINSTNLLNMWVKRYKNTYVMPAMSSAISVSNKTKDVRDTVAEGFLCSAMCCGNDVSHINQTCLLSSAQCSAGSYSVTPENFEKSMVIQSVRRIIDTTKNWTNDRDQFYAPSEILSQEFINDCVIWSAFADSNNTVSLKDVKYKGKVYQIPNNLYPFLLKEIKNWKCNLDNISLQISSANEDRFLAKWLQNKNLSQEAKNVLEKAKELYKYFYKEICNTHWMNFKIENWDVGLWQIKQALKEVDLGTKEINNLKFTHKELGKKLLPQIYKYGFINKDIEFFDKE